MDIIRGSGPLQIHVLQRVAATLLQLDAEGDGELAHTDPVQTLRVEADLLTQGWYFPQFLRSSGRNGFSI